MDRLWVRALVSAAIAGLWITSIALPVVDTRSASGIETVLGSEILQIGWMGILVLQFGWFANVLLVPGLVLATGWPSRAPKVNVVIATILLVLAVNAAFWSDFPMDNGEIPIVDYRIGYWLWMSSVVGASAWLLVCRFKGTRDEGDEAIRIEALR